MSNITLDLPEVREVIEKALAEQKSVDSLLGFLAGVITAHFVAAGYTEQQWMEFCLRTYRECADDWRLRTDVTN